MFTFCELLKKLTKYKELSSSTNCINNIIKEKAIFSK